METLIALLFILLPVIFKLIGKKFEQAGNPDAAERMRKIAEVLGSSEEKDDEPSDEPEVFTAPAPVVPPSPFVTTPLPVTENVVRQTAPKAAPKPASKPKPAARKPILQEDAQKKGEKIDPKKLVIYSEIMKPKYTE